MMPRISERFIFEISEFEAYQQQDGIMRKSPYEPIGYSRDDIRRTHELSGRHGWKRKEGPMVVTLVEQLKSIDIDRAHIDDVIALLAFAKMLRTEYEARQYSVPEWIDDKIRLMSRYTEMHRRDALELRLKEARAQQAALMTPTEKREKLAADIAKMEQELAVTK